VWKDSRLLPRRFYFKTLESAAAAALVKVYDSGMIKKRYEYETMRKEGEPH
jgi:hypothetical protein